MSVLFCVNLVVAAWGLTKIVNQLQRTLSDKKRRVAIFADRAHMSAFLMFVASVICWLLDNYFCSALNTLPLGIPYPHLHMWWHLLTAGALYCIGVVLHIDDKKEASQLETYLFCGVPRVVCDA
eukprot:TRINITY_DN13501_c0_g1_i2.p1 TRINITY_DN13501_c0_g1~~TRINITY_DN13501_c0_g1_i2.p1  ORF type:complete len:124 (-),score=15.85 TRINITY_DN13501_c0_g1_i2:564-935(-)